MRRLLGLLVAPCVALLPASSAGAAVHRFGGATAAEAAPMVAPVAMAASPTGDGYWLADSVGGVFAVGDAEYAGSVPGMRAAGVPVGDVRVVAMAAAPAGGGYWLADVEGGVFAFGDARYAGSLPELRAAGAPVGPVGVTAMAPTSSGKGYWLADREGGIFTFGDATYAGSLPELRAAGVGLGEVHVVAMAATPTGKGYWLADSTGGVFTFGDAAYAGSLPELRAAGIPVSDVRVVAMAATPSGRGYWLTDSAGGVFTFGDARYAGSLPELGAGPRRPAAAIAPDPGGAGYRIATRTLAMPADGPLSSPFGPRGGRMHEGIDIDTDHGAPIVAAEGGRVVRAGPDGGGYGNMVVIDHGGGLATMYAHQSRVATSAGAHVARGDVIGYVGATGHATGSHLHFEVWVDGRPVDPFGYLRA